MRADVVRTEAFRAAIGVLCRGKVVLDVGTGDAALFALEAARAGATRVFAVEGDSASAARARLAVGAAEDAGVVADGTVTVLNLLSTELSAGDLDGAAVRHSFAFGRTRLMLAG